MHAILPCNNQTVAVQEQLKDEMKRTTAAERHVEEVDRKRLFAEQQQHGAERRTVEALAPFKGRAEAAEQRLVVTSSELEVIFPQYEASLAKLCRICLACPKQMMTLLHETPTDKPVT